MIQSSEQSITYKLDKAHFQECFEQSASPVNKNDYIKALILGVLGVALFFVEAEHYYIPFFIFCLAVVEMLSVKYRQTWWVWRQLMGKSGNSSVKLTVDQEGVRSDSEYINIQIGWNEIGSITETDKGYLLNHKNGVNYLSKSHLTKAMLEILMSKIEQFKSGNR